MEKEELEKWREGGTRKSRVSLGVGPAAQLDCLLQWEPCPSSIACVCEWGFISVCVCVYIEQGAKFHSLVSVGHSRAPTKEAGPPLAEEATRTSAQN